MRPLVSDFHDTENISEPARTKKEDSDLPANSQNNPQVSEQQTQELAGKFCDFASKSHIEIGKNLSPGGTAGNSNGGKALELRSNEAHRGG